MKLTVLGSGTSSGVPYITCDCPVCTSTNPKNKRWRSSCFIQTQDKNILIDTGPDLRTQCLAFGIKRVDAVLYTHTHADHVHGIDDVRAFNAKQKEPIPVYGNKKHLDYLAQMFVYIFNPNTIYPSLVPKLIPYPVDDDFEIDGQKVQLIPCHHGAAGMTYNYRVGNLAWLTDTNGIPEGSLAKLKGLDYLFIDGLRLEPHPTHFHLEESLKMAKTIGAKQTYLIHLTHDYDHDDFDKKLPAGVNLAYDGLVVET